MYSLFALIVGVLVASSASAQLQPPLQHLPLTPTITIAPPAPEIKKDPKPEAARPIEEVKKAEPQKAK